MLSRRIFISAVSSEYAGLRVALDNTLRRAGIDPDYQGIFPHAPEDTVLMLSNRIRLCPLLVHIVGEEPGRTADAAGVAEFLHSLGTEEFLAANPALRADLGDCAAITYTQWEALLALHHGVKLLVYLPASARAADSNVIREDFRQKNHIDRLRLGKVRHYCFCDDEHHFNRVIPADLYSHFGPPAEPAREVPCSLPQRNGLFRGRKAQLQQLAETFRSVPVIGITQQVALFASGGVGKSSLALEFAWHCAGLGRDGYAGGVFWCDCRGGDAESLAQELAGLAAALDIRIQGDESAFDVARRVRDRLGSGPPSLLVLDNVLDAEQWKNPDWRVLLPSGNCRRLLTTRAETLGDHRANVTMLALESLSTQDARALLHAYRDDVVIAAADDAVLAIIEWFGGLAIGLTVVGIYMASPSNRSLSFDAYWKSLREKKLDTVRDTESLATPADYGNRVDAVIEDLYYSRTQVEQFALQFASVLPHAEISDRWLVELLSEDGAARRAAGSVPPGYASYPHHVVARLVASGVLQRTTNTPARMTVALHKVIREKLGEILRQHPARCREVSDHVGRFLRRSDYRSRQWTRAIKESANFSGARELLDSMARDESDPDNYQYNSLLTKADSFAQARQVLAEMRAVNLRPDEYTFNILISKADSPDEARQLFAEMRAMNVSPNAYTFTSLMSKADSFAAAKEILAEISSAGQKPTIEMLNTLLSKATSDAERHEAEQRMTGLGLKPSHVTFTSKMHTAPSYAEARQFFDAMRAHGCQPDLFACNVLLSKADTYAEACEAFAELRRMRHKPALYTYNILLGKTDSYSEARGVLARLRNAGYEPELFTYNTLLGKADSYAEACKVLAELQAAGYQPDTYTCTRFCWHAGSFAEATDAVARWLGAGGTADASLYNFLLSRITSQDEFRIAVAAFGRSGLVPSIKTFKTLQAISAVADADACFAWLALQTHQPELACFGVLLSAQSSHAQARAAIARLEELGVLLDASVFQAQHKKSVTAEQRSETLAQLLAAGFKPDWNIVISGAQSYAEARAMADLVLAQGCAPDIKLYTALIGKTRSYAEARQLIDEALAQGMTIPSGMFSQLFKRGAGLPPGAQALAWYLSFSNPSTDPINGLIATLIKYCRLDEASVVAAGYAGLPAAQKLARLLADELPEEQPGAPAAPDT